jgi:hypothetical protein
MLNLIEKVNSSPVMSQIFHVQLAREREKKKTCSVDWSVFLDPEAKDNCSWRSWWCGGCWLPVEPMSKTSDSSTRLLLHKLFIGIFTKKFRISSGFWKSFTILYQVILPSMAWWIYSSQQGIARKKFLMNKAIGFPHNS